MRKLTFKSYLLSQCRVFSEFDSTSLYVFSQLSENNARLKDTLSMYLIMYTSEELRGRLLKKFSYLNSSCKKLEGVREENIESFLKNDELSEFRTIYNNFLYLQNHKANEDKIKEMMYEKIKQVKHEKNITNYRVYKDLSLNPGNVNAFLKNADMGKVSLNTVRKILAFVQNY
ncbi:MAG TPA: hypothetical protein IAD22_01430 [Candidatus Limousia pullorum]|uniref:Uncharacterized protein n=1 Tax=Candidatus Limousia pullorum TaxID=2840860 RepID=A0A9D1LXB5_9FIRM|nr:hypothetical protein [Candidatus Limousia pullorum]